MINDINNLITDKMKYFLISLFFISFINMDILSQQYKRDTRIQMFKEDGNNIYKSDQITDIDLLQALEFSGITINKFNLGPFDKKYKLLMLIDEYKDGKNVKSDTLLDNDNEYHYYEVGEKNYYTDYIDQIKVISKVQDTVLAFQFITYGLSFKKEVNLQKYSTESFYNLRSYIDTRWKLNEKIPLLVYASSWKDKKYGFQRFCGVVNLSKDNEKTNELLSSSPHYYSISYIVEEIK